jgi:hypothetical protein
MIETLKVSLLTMMLTVWSTIAMAQTPPGGTPGTPGGGTTSPSETTTGATPGAAAGEGMDWVWIIVAVVVIAALLYYFLGRGRSTRV